MRLLVLCDLSGAEGGTESYLARVLPALREGDAEIAIAARRVDDPQAFGARATEIAWGAEGEAGDARAAGRVAALVRDWRPDVVLASNVHDPAALAAARTARRLVVRVHDHRLFCPQGDRRLPHSGAACASAMSATTCLAHALVSGCVSGASPRTLRLLASRLRLARVVRSADALVVSAPFVAELCARNGVDPARVALVPPPFAGPIVRAPRPARDRVLFAGRLVRDKGLASLVRALGKIPPEGRPALDVAGAPTPESAGVPALAARLGVRLAMLGRLAPEAIHAAIDAASLVAVPSLWPEPFGLVGIEAHARGRPVVAYDAGGVTSWLGEGGIAVTCGDEAALASAIVAMLDADAWSRYSDAALRQAPAYRVERHAAALAALFATLAA